MTSKILFEDVIKVLKEHAFVSSDYPLILSFEMRCDLKTQKNVVTILRREIDDLIYPVPDDFDDYEFYPSPEELRGRIIIKGSGKLLHKAPSPDQQQFTDEENLTEGNDALSVSSQSEAHISVEDSTDSMGNVSERLNSHRREKMWNWVLQKRIPPLDSRKVMTKVDEKDSFEETNELNLSSKVLGLDASPNERRRQLAKLESNEKKAVKFRGFPSQGRNKPRMLTVQANMGDIWSNIKSFRSSMRNSVDGGTLRRATTLKLQVENGVIVFDDKVLPEETSINKDRKESSQGSDVYVHKRNVSTPETDTGSFKKAAAQRRSISQVSPQTVKNMRTNKKHATNSEQVKNNKMNPKPLSTVSPYTFIIKGVDGTIQRPTTQQTNNKLKKKKSSHLNPELNNLYGMIGRRFDLEDDRRVWEISSMNENRIAKLFKVQQREIIDFNKQFLTRIYPHGSRIDSSNFDPIIGWAAGCQMIALNFQKGDESMLLNYAKFTSNGGLQCGYVLKPDYMQHESYLDKNLALYPYQFKKAVKKISIQVISAQQIRPDDLVVNEIIDPYIEVKIRGLEIDEQNNTIYRTTTIKDNGFHPVWGGIKDPNRFEFYIHAPDFCMLVFTAYHDDVIKRERMGWYAIEINNLQQGYRVVPLLNSLLQPIKGSFIFCRVIISDL